MLHATLTQQFPARFFDSFEELPQLSEVCRSDPVTSVDLSCTYTMA